MSGAQFLRSEAVPKIQDHYDFYADHVIVKSKSGNTYLITASLECNCVGYSYRQECRHTQYVTEHGWAPDTKPQPTPITARQQSILDQITKPH